MKIQIPTYREPVTLHLATDVKDAEVMEIINAYNGKLDEVGLLLYIMGYENDPRELGDIPRVRGFCRRLVNLGLLSVLHITTTIAGFAKSPLTMAECNGLGAFEVWLMAENKMPDPLKPNPMGVEVLGDFEKALTNSNRMLDRRNSK